MIPHPGKVNIQARTISFTVPQFTEESLFEAPTPMIAMVFVCVVLTGIPVTEEISREIEAAISAAKP